MSSQTQVFKSERRRKIFIAAQKIFVGSTAQIRDRNAVRKIISSHPETFQPLNQSFGKDTVFSTILNFLSSGEFYSKLKAKRTFHGPSPARSLQHDALEEEATKSEAQALDEASRSDMDIGEYAKASPESDTAGFDLVEDALPFEPLSLFPSYLSYSSQHKLLNTVQRVLEDCCYNWATKWTPELLTERRWSCPEAVELSTWTEVLPQLLELINIAATTCESGEALAETLRATHPLRHAAVHRLPTTVGGIEKMLQNALRLATALQDQERMVKLDDISADLKAIILDMKLRKNELESQLDEELRNIQKQRENQRKALDRKEREAKLNMLEQDQKNTATISSHFEDSISNLTSTGEKHASNAEHTSSPDVDSGEYESDAMEDDTAHELRTQPEDTAATDTAHDDAESKTSTHFDTRSSLESLPEIATQLTTENGTAAFPPELDDPEEPGSSTGDHGSLTNGVKNQH